MDAVQIVQYLVVEFGELLVDTDNTVFLTLMALLSVRTSCAVLALVVFFRSAKLVAFYRRGSQKKESLPVRTDHISFMVYGKVAGAVRIIPVFPVLVFSFIHGEFHVLLHTMLFAVHIVIETSIACIRYRILWIKPVSLFKAIHEWLKAVHIRCIGIYIVMSDKLVADHHLQIISRQQLVILHVVFLESHKGSVMVGLGIAVSLLTADHDLFSITSQLLPAVINLFIEPLDRGLVLTLSVSKILGCHSGSYQESVQYILYIFNGIFLTDIEYGSLVKCHIGIDIFQ